MKRIVLCLILFILYNCGMQMRPANSAIDTETTKNKIMCRDLCAKKNTVVKFIRASGKVEWPKINIISIFDKTACECDFGKVQCDNK